jgi:transposase-like protein
VKTLTKKKIREYVKSGGNYCPFCGSEDITGGDRNTDGGVHSQEIYCQGCKKDWQDVYSLTGIYVEA